MDSGTETEREQAGQASPSPGVGVSEMVERVGRAIGAELVRQELAGEDFDEAESNAALARAAILAMRPELDLLTVFADLCEKIETGTAGVVADDTFVGVQMKELRRARDAALVPTGGGG